MSPTPAEIREARLAAGLTLKQAAALVHVDIRTWQRWEAGDREMSPAHWALFRIKSGYWRPGMAVDLETACADILRKYDDDPETAHAAEDRLLWGFVKHVASTSRDKNSAQLARLLMGELGDKPRSRWYS